MANVKMSDLHPDYDSWFDCWYSDKKDMLNIMYHNMMSDLDAGYNPLGDCIKRQKQMISDYEKGMEVWLASRVDTLGTSQKAQKFKNIFISNPVIRVKSCMACTSQNTKLKKHTSSMLENQRNSSCNSGHMATTML